MFKVFNSYKEKKTAQILISLVNNNIYEIIKITTSAKRNNKKYQIMINRTDNIKISIKDCEIFNRLFLELLKKYNIELKGYSVEISSPGINKQLTRFNDLIRLKEKSIKVQTLSPLLNKKIIKGYIKNINKNFISVKLSKSKNIKNIEYDTIIELFLQENSKKNYFYC